MRADSRFVPSKWETALLCSDVSHWLGANLEAALDMYSQNNQMNLLFFKLKQTNREHVIHRVRSWNNRMCYMACYVLYGWKVTITIIHIRARSFHRYFRYAIYTWCSASYLMITLYGLLNFTNVQSNYICICNSILPCSSLHSPYNEVFFQKRMLIYFQVILSTLIGNVKCITLLIPSFPSDLWTAIYCFYV